MHALGIVKISHMMFECLLLLLVPICFIFIGVMIKVILIFNCLIAIFVPKGWRLGLSSGVNQVRLDLNLGLLIVIIWYWLGLNLSYD